MNPALNAVITPTFDRALAHVERGVTGPFAGVPFLLKDLALELEGVRCCEGSRFTRDHVSTYTSEAVRRMEDTGLVILGKTNTPEFGMVPTTEPERFGPTRNPWDPSRSTSGSSGGAAAAVASRMVPMAHADDLGGSIRYPAAACGLFGLKPTRGRITYAPQYGDVVSGWASEFAVTRSVRDAAALLDALAGTSAGDPYAAPPPVRPFTHEVTTEPGRLRVGYTTRTADGSPGHPDCVTALDAMLAALAELGHEVIDSELPAFDEVTGAAIGTVFNAATAWIVGYWTRELGRAPEPGELEPLTQCFWEMGREVPRRRLPARDRGAAATVTAHRGVVRRLRRVPEPDHVGATRADRRDHLDRRRPDARARARRSHRRVLGRDRQLHRATRDVRPRGRERRRPADGRALARPVR